MRTIKPSRRTGADVPLIQSTQYANNSTFIAGAVMVLAAGIAQEQANPVPNAGAIYGFAMEPADSHPGYDAANSKQVTVVTGRDQVTSIARATRSQEFSAQLVNGSAAAIAPVQADVGAKYGLKSYNNADGKAVWCVDKALSGASACVQVADIDVDQNIVFFKVLEANLQIA